MQSFSSFTYHLSRRNVYVADRLSDVLMCACKKIFIHIYNIVTCRNIIAYRRYCCGNRVYIVTWIRKYIKYVIFVQMRNKLATLHGLIMNHLSFSLSLRERIDGILIYTSAAIL